MSLPITKRSPVAVVFVITVGMGLLASKLLAQKKAADDPVIHLRIGVGVRDVIEELVLKNKNLIGPTKRVFLSVLLSQHPKLMESLQQRFSESPNLGLNLAIRQGNYELYEADGQDAVTVVLEDTDHNREQLLYVMSTYPSKGDAEAAEDFRHRLSKVANLTMSITLNQEVKP